MTCFLTRICRRGLPAAGLPLFLAGAAFADEVTDWHEHMLTAQVKAGTNALFASRESALLSSAVFDAVNGIDRKYDPVYVSDEAPRGASKRAAAVQAAYVILVARFPSQADELSDKRDASLEAIGDGGQNESVKRGVEWGQEVAEAILDWRSTDGFSPAPAAYYGEDEPGVWRSTPPAFAPALGLQFATMTPWGIESPDQFRPGGPPDMDSDQYLEEFEEVRTMGSETGSNRTADQTDSARFWHGSTASYLWNRAALDLLADADTDLSENAHLLATMNLAVADALIACWESKYYYDFWRPITAIQLADTDGNDDTSADTSWKPLIATPPFPEYTSGHSSASSAAAAVLADHFGDDTEFSVQSHSNSSWIRSFDSFSEAVEEVADARIFAGIHFRTACDDGVVIGTGVAEYYLDNLLGRVHGSDD